MIKGSIKRKDKSSPPRTRPHLCHPGTRPHLCHPENSRPKERIIQDLSNADDLPSKLLVQILNSEPSPHRARRGFAFRMTRGRCWVGKDNMASIKKKFDIQKERNLKMIKGSIKRKDKSSPPRTRPHLCHPGTRPHLCHPGNLPTAGKNFAISCHPGKISTEEKFYSGSPFAQRLNRSPIDLPSKLFVQILNSEPSPHRARRGFAQDDKGSLLGWEG